MRRVRVSRLGAVACLLAAAMLDGSAIGQVNAAATAALLGKAHALEVRGRMEMAAQSWQQVLLSDPDNTEALGGLARAAKLSGNAALARTYLEKLRSLDPRSPEIARAESLAAKQNHDAELAEAGKFAQAGQYAQAMTVYRKVFGNSPPPGNWALAYYETEAATEESRPHAIAGLRALAAKYPADPRYSIALGRILTYNPKTREEGRRILGRHPGDQQAVEAIRQSLVWDAANPASGPEIRAYLSKHNDPQLTQLLQDQPKLPPARAARPKSAAAEGAPLAETQPERAAQRVAGKELQQAYQSLNAKRFDEAEQHFREVLAADPESASALAGMGYVRMQQSNFGGALSFLEQAKQNGDHGAGLDAALATAKFWFTMGEGATALNENDLPAAEQQYQAALSLRPNSPEALGGLGGTLLKAQQPKAAAEVFDRLTRQKPSDLAAWRGLFMAQFASGTAPQALLTERRIPPAMRSQLMHDPDFLRTLASAYSAVGRDVDAQRTLSSALDLPFPANAGGLKVEAQLQYANLLQQANRLDQAAGLYRQVLAADMSNAPAWMGLVRVEHAMRRDEQAVQTLQSMPPAIYQTAMRDGGFESTVAAVYQEGNRQEVAQQILERAVSQQTAANQRPPAGLELQLAGTYLARNMPQRAFPIYRQVLAENPESPDAWKGLLSVLHTAGRDREALTEIQQIPASLRAQLENDVDYLQTVGSVYNAIGQPAQAMVFINRVQQHYNVQHTLAPADVDIQDAWLLFNGQNDAGLYRQLMLLGGRPDLSDEQRRAVQTIWASWAVRRANQAAASGDGKRSLAILNAAAKSFPQNPGVLRALASGYARAGLPRQAVQIFRSQDMTAATAADYKAAVGAALAAGDAKSAEVWLRYGLDSYPRDAQMLMLGAKFEEARGNSGRASDYYRASLAALPPGDPGAELASELSQPAITARLPNAAQPQDLAALLSAPAEGQLDPEALSAEISRPYLPSYGNLSGQAPVELPGAAAAVPSYMSNPQARPAQGRRGSTAGTLRDYVPQASAAQPGPDLPQPFPVQPSPTQSFPIQASTQTQIPIQIPTQIPAQAAQLPPDLPSYPATGLQALPVTPRPTDLASGYAAVPQQALSSMATGSTLPDQALTPYAGAAAPIAPVTLPSMAATSVPQGQPRAIELSREQPQYAAAAPPVVQPVALPPLTRSTSAQGQGFQPVDVGPQFAASPAPESPAALPAFRSPDLPALAPPDAASLRRAQPQVIANLAPYAPPLTGGGYSPSPVPVQLGREVAPSDAAQQEITDVLPTARYVPNASKRQGGQAGSMRSLDDGSNTLTMHNMQYKRNVGTNGGDASAQQYPQPDVAPPGVPSRTVRRRIRRSAPAAAPSAPTSYDQGHLPSLSYPAAQQPLSTQTYPALLPAAPEGTPPTDADLVAKAVPPLRGSFDPHAAVVPMPLSQRQQTELELATLEASYSAWLGGSGSGRYRSGTAGLDRLVDIEAPVEASAVLGKSVRATVVAQPVFLNAGLIDTAAAANVRAGGATPPVIGTLSTDAIATPTQQFASGVGGELQLTTANLGVAVGYTPYEFLVRNVTGRFQWRPAGKHLTLFANRDNVKDTQLSYAGIRDPGTITALNSGTIWGGVISTTGGARIDIGNQRSGLYLTGDGGTLTGYNVLDNKKYEGGMGAYFQVKRWPGYGSLNVGGNFFAMHYDHNERGLSFGNGGYFSPNVYFLASVPVTYNGYYKTDFHYTVTGNVGLQVFQEDAAPYFPLNPASGSTVGNPQYAVNSNTGLNYALNSEGAYRIADHWYTGGFLSANNTNNYNTVSGGFFVRYLFRQQVPTEDYPTGLFPVSGFRPLRVP